MRRAFMLFGLALVGMEACTADARSELLAGTADYLSANESDYLNTKVTVNVEEGISGIPQDASQPIDLTKIFFTFHTVDAETHKSGSIIYAGFAENEEEAVRSHFDKFPERTRPLIGVLKKTKVRGLLYLDCKMADQRVSGSSAGGDEAQADSVPAPAGGQSSDDVNNRAIASTVIIRTDTGGGSGFVIEEHGKKFIVTNQHVLLGAAPDKLEILTTAGAKLKPLALQTVPDLDLARIEVAEGPPALLLTSEAAIEEPVATVGNSLDAGVVTINRGEIQGIGGGEIEVSCEVVPGQSGGPLINAAGEVIGVTTYILLADKGQISEDTRYAKKRYFTVRLGPDATWLRVDSWADYAKVGAAVRAGEELLEQALDIAVSAEGGPSTHYTSYSGGHAGLLEAVKQHNRFADKMTEMDGAVVTATELKRNNSILATSFRGVYKAIIKACNDQEALLRREIGFGRPKRYPWLLKRTEETAKMLSSLSQAVESRSKARPNFLSW